MDRVIAGCQVQPAFFVAKKAPGKIPGRCVTNLKFTLMEAGAGNGSHDDCDTSRCQAEKDQCCKNTTSLFFHILSP